MQSELQTSLRERYPDLFDQTDSTLPINRWGIEVGEGWHGIIDAVLDVVSWHCRDQGKRLTVIDCKQKFGTLRVMFRGDVDDHIRGAVDAALAISARTCERCGAPGKFCDCRGLLVSPSFLWGHLNRTSSTAAHAAPAACAPRGGPMLTQLGPLAYACPSSTERETDAEAHAAAALQVIFTLPPLPIDRLPIDDNITLICDQ